MINLQKNTNLYNLEPSKNGILFFIKSKFPLLFSKKYRQNLLMSPKSNNIILKIISLEFKHDKDIMLQAMRANTHRVKYMDENLRNNKEVMWSAIKHANIAYQYIGKNLTNDSELLLATIEELNGDIFGFTALKYASDHLRNAPDIVKKLLESKAANIKYISKNLMQNRDFVLEKEVMKALCNIDNIKYISKELLDDRSFVLEFCKKALFSFSIAPISSQLKDDEEIILQSTFKNKENFKYASKRLNSDRSFIMEAINYCINGGICISKLSAELKNDKEIILKTVKKNAHNLEYVSGDLRNDPDVINLAITSYNVYHMGQYIFKYIGNDLKNNKEFMLTKIKAGGLGLKYLPRHLRQDKDIVLNAVEENGKAIRYASSKLRRNRQIIASAINNNPTAIKYLDYGVAVNNKDLIKIGISISNVFNLLPKKLKYDKELMYISVQNHGLSLKDFPKEYRHDYTLISLAIKQEGSVIGYAPDNIKNDINFFYEAIKTNIYSLKHANHTILDNREFIVKALEYSSASLFYASDKLKDDKELVLSAITSINGYSFSYASDRLKNDKQTILELCMKNPHHIQYAAQEIRQEIGDNDPVYYINAQNNYNALEAKVPVNKTTIVKNRNKI